MDLFSKCKALYEKIRYFEYGIPVDGVIKPVPSAEYFVKNYHFLKPEEFEKYGGGICWDYVEYERKFLEVNDIDFNQYYIITNTPPNYDTHTFITVKDGDELIYIESSFKRVEHIIDGVQKFKSLEDIVRLITTNMWYCNDNDKHFDEFKYDVCKFKGHPQYGCTCQEYMDWMDNNSDIVIQDVTINPKKVNEDELPVEEFSVNKIDTKFTQFVCESVNDPEEYDESLHDHINDEDDVYNESWTDFKNGVHPSSGLMFHVSLKNDMDGKTITPQLPSYITDGGELDDNYQEDTKTKRLCVSPSIEGCLIAILSYNKIREHVGDKFYVYTPEKPFSQYKHKTNKEIVKDKLVFDANITKEAWILEPCKLKLYGIIKLKKVKDLKQKSTVEKGIKMNTIKLDYEWIMTPKASGKFNKAIGDSPDKESDKKEKPIKEYDNILMSNDEFFMESQATRNKVLERLDYDPATKTIDTGIKKKTGEPIRIKFKIKPDLVEDYDTEALICTPDKDYKNIDKFIKKSYIAANRQVLSQRNNAPLASIYHEIGHFVVELIKNYKEEIEKPTKHTAKDICKYLEKAGIYKQLDDATLNFHDKDPEEYFADTYAASRTSTHAVRHMLTKTYDENIQNMYGTIKRMEKELEQHKDSAELYKKYTDEISAAKSALNKIKNDPTYKSLKTKKDEKSLNDKEKKKFKELKSLIKQYKDKINELQEEIDDTEWPVDYEENEMNSELMKQEKNGKRLRTDIATGYKPSPKKDKKPIKESFESYDNDDLYMESSETEEKYDKNLNKIKTLKTAIDKIKDDETYKSLKAKKKSKKGLNEKEQKKLGEIKALLKYYKGMKKNLQYELDDLEELDWVDEDDSPKKEEPKKDKKKDKKKTIKESYDCILMDNDEFFDLMK